MKKKTKKKGDTTKGVKKIRFSFIAPEAKTVSIAGDFNQWDTSSHPMKKDKKGLWGISVPLPSGQHEYLFFVDGEWLFDPNCSCPVDNPFGTENCVIIVE
jgi:1,4-alpha-glucan branching enzyme